MSRSDAWVILLAGLISCSGSGGEGADDTSTTTDPNSMGTAGMPSGGPTGASAELVGGWSRTTPVTMGADEVDVDWFAEADGTCRVSMSDASGLAIEFDCVYAVPAMGEFTTEDDRCTDGMGTYTYTIDASGLLSFTLVSDPCKDRSATLAGDWTPID